MKKFSIIVVAMLQLCLGTSLFAAPTQRHTMQDDEPTESFVEYLIEFKQKALEERIERDEDVKIVLEGRVNTVDVTDEEREELLELEELLNKVISLFDQMIELGEQERLTEMWELYQQDDNSYYFIMLSLNDRDNFDLQVKFMLEVVYEVVPEEERSQVCAEMFRTLNIIYDLKYMFNVESLDLRAYVLSKMFEVIFYENMEDFKSILEISEDMLELDNVWDVEENKTGKVTFYECLFQAKVMLDDLYDIETYLSDAISWCKECLEGDFMDEEEIAAVEESLANFIEFEESIKEYLYEE